VVDDVDQIPEIAPEPVDPPDDQGVAGAQLGQARVPLRAVGLGAAGAVGVELEAVLGGERVELQLEFWSAVDTRAYPILAATSVREFASGYADDRDDLPPGESPQVGGQRPDPPDFGDARGAPVDRRRPSSLVGGTRC